jgi:hypothetical protein
MEAASPVSLPNLSICPDSVRCFNTQGSLYLRGIVGPRKYVKWE